MNLHDGIVYGPVRSRRLGRSLGVNVLPPGVKICNMNCGYCQYGWTNGRPKSGTSAWPAPLRIEKAVGARLREAARQNELIDRITVAGHGEPTLHPEFEDIAERLCRLRDRVAPGIPLSILSNSTTAFWPDVRRGLALFDERHMKLDAGDPVTCARINGGGTSVRQVIEALRILPRIIIQSMFVTDRARHIDNTTDTAINEWLSAIYTIQPSRVEVYSLDRPAAHPALQTVPAPKLREIAHRVRSLGIEATAIEKV